MPPIYFPTTAIVSLHCVTHAGASAEIAGVGKEGVVGISLFMGGDPTPSSAVVQTAGHAYRVERQQLKQEFDRGVATQHLLLRYAQALMTPISQQAVAAAVRRAPAPGRCRHGVTRQRAYLAAGADAGTGGGVPTSRVTSSR